MKKIITFGQSTAILERSKMAATLQITPIQTNTPLPMPLAELADALNEAENIDVHAILPARGKIAFTVEKGASNAEVIDIVCDAIAAVFDTDTVVSNERAETIV